jgi:hypothetical protein
MRKTNEGTVTLDASRPPIRRVTVEGTITEAAVRAYLADAARLLANGDEHVLVYDLLRMNALGAVHRRIQAQWIVEHRVGIRKLCRGAGFAMYSAVQRGALTALLWLTPLPFDHAIFATVVEAESWALQQMKQQTKQHSARPKGWGRRADP